MKARLARIAGLVLAGTLVVSTAAIDQKSKNTDADTSATVASGVTSALSGSLSDAAMGVAGVSGMDIARTAQGQEAVEEGTESAEAGVDASTSSAAAGVSAELADAATVASQAQDELTRKAAGEQDQILDIHHRAKYHKSHQAPMGNCPAKLLATTASAEEQRERKNAIPISTRRGRNSPSPPFPHGNDLSRGWNRRIPGRPAQGTSQH